MGWRWMWQNCRFLFETWCEVWRAWWTHRRDYITLAEFDRRHGIEGRVK
jgi:hypothetical protein